MFFFFKQKTAYEMRISDWSSDVCSSDLRSPLSEPSERYSHMEYNARGGLGGRLGERLGEKRQAAVHAVVDRGVVVRELLVDVRHGLRLQQAVQAARAVDEVVLVAAAAVDPQGLQLLQLPGVPPGQHDRVPLHNPKSAGE